LTSANSAGTTIEFYLDSIRNPGDYSTPGTVYMSIETVSGGKVDSGSFSGWADDLYTNSFIDHFHVDAGSLMAGDEPVTYFFHIEPITRVVQGAYLILELPTELEIASVIGLARGCADGDISGFSYSILTCTYS
jgi:hypothetical protein